MCSGVHLKIVFLKLKLQFKLLRKVAFWLKIV